jgi:hypothetical protein
MAMLGQLEEEEGCHPGWLGCVGCTGRMAGWVNCAKSQENFLSE